MKNINFRKLFTEMQSLARYLPNANTITEARAQEICRKFGGCLQDEMDNFNQANLYGQQVMKRADLRNEGLGMYHNAEELFYGYVYEEYREAHADSAAVARRERYDD